jgi:phosphoesterase RecJ-like protein
MIARLAHALSVEIDADTATVLYLALETDTGGFRFANATADAFDAAADLVRRGARVETVAHWVHDSQPAAAVRLLAEMLGTLALHDDGRIATVYLTDAMFERAGATAADAEDLVDHPRSIDGVRAVALLRQLGDGEYKGSLRSRGPVNVESIARRLGGGGHKNAAGFETSGGGPEEILEGLVTSLSEAIQQVKE